MAKAVAQDSKGHHKRPVVRVQLGEDDVHLSKKGSFEGGEREAQTKSSKDSGVDEAKRSLRVRQLFRTHWLTYPTGHNPRVLIVVFVEDMGLMTGLLLPISSYACEESKVEGFLLEGR